jgi:OFA family oxalate/formate antiporter-like MFS transporter
MALLRRWFPPGLPLPRRLPFYYGWVIVGCVACALVARQGASVAVLSVFVKPMGDALGWSRAQVSGAVSLGNVLGGITAPLWGRWADRVGARAVLSLGVLMVGVGAAALSQVSSLWAFYGAYSIVRLAFASPLDIGGTVAIANWFLRRRALALALANFSGGLFQGLLPLLVQGVILWQGWRAGWLVVAALALGVGLLPTLLLMRRRPEDVGLQPDGAGTPSPGKVASPPLEEPSFTPRQALQTPTLWLLLVYSGLAFLVQAGVSLHQAPHLLQRGIPAPWAAGVVSGFGFASAGGQLLWGVVASRWPLRYALSAAAFTVVGGIVVLATTHHVAQGLLGGVIFGGGVGGFLTLVPLTWANYYGRASLGTIRGITLPVQVGGQAVGPLLIGGLYDLHHSYDAALALAAGLVALAGALALLAKPPRSPTAGRARGGG